MPIERELMSVAPFQDDTPACQARRASGTSWIDAAVLVDEIMRGDFGGRIGEARERFLARLSCRCSAAAACRSRAVRASWFGEANDARRLEIGLQSSWIDQHAGIEQALRIERLLGGAQRVGEQRRALAVVPRAMIAPDRMMMRDRAAVLDHGIERRALDRAPLRAELARLAERMEGEVGRRPVRVDMREAAGDLARCGRSPHGSRSRSRALIASWNVSKRSQVIAVSNVSLMTPRRISRSIA